MIAKTGHCHTDRHEQCTGYLYWHNPPRYDGRCLCRCHRQPIPLYLPAGTRRDSDGRVIR